MVTGYAFPDALLQHALPDPDKLSIDIHQLQEKRDHLVRSLQEIGYQIYHPEGTLLKTRPKAGNTSLRSCYIKCWRISGAATISS
jgi:hypothetical protein